MSPSTESTVDKVIENKFLLAFQRIGVAVLLLMFPIVVGWVSGISGAVAEVKEQQNIAHARDVLVTQQRGDEMSDLKQQIISLTAVVAAQGNKASDQNTAVLQSIARLEATIARQP